MKCSNYNVILSGCPCCMYNVFMYIIHPSWDIKGYKWYGMGQAIHLFTHMPTRSTHNKYKCKQSNRMCLFI